MPKISVIIPVYNTEKFLPRCLESVCNQTLSDIEIICINDYSTDNSLKILKEYPVKIIDLPENKGAAFARNKGIEAATGEYIGFVDSDDFVDLDFYEKLYNRAVETGADAVKGNYKDSETGYIDYSLNKKIAENKNNFAFAYCSAIFRTSIIKNNNINFPSLIDMEDPVFTFEFALNANKVEIVDVAHINIVKHPESSTSRILSSDRIKSRLSGLEKIIQLADKYNSESSDYSFVIGIWFYMVMINSAENIDFDSKNILANGLLDLYNQLKNKKSITKIIKNYSEILGEFLETNNTQGLLNYTQSFCQKQLFLKQLRNRIKTTSKCNV